ncbi:phosphatase PAP2 family protein [uncultured Streptococcus sp.]|uniref:phosphatase PAP2 family protein n=1 Tax=uncultured Streptococcus sp. TaxID=83427 RepID=UPI001175410B|nr:phosphatase PAP2 family protein [uncultured Streptococcus sp.]VTY24585.1 Undecaprenyl-diphosphatase BcrC [Streptococcus salivarius]VUW84089.1 Undecaprenyl-diphosphatase BcrC [Streptococcus thermophilus]
MKHKQIHYIYTSFALLLFVALGYMVKFYPEALTGFDSSIQTWVRGDLPTGLTHFFKAVTVLGNTPVQAIIAIVAVIWLYLNQYKSEAIFVGTSGVLASIMIVSLKYIYQRPRPSITHLVHAGGYSFPSGHSLGTFMILGAIAIVLAQRLAKKGAKVVIYIVTGLLIALVGLSRIYMGVHYPTDVLAGFTLAFGLLNAIYPTYDRIRFEWRFQSKQK